MTTARRAIHLPASLPPRGLSRGEAAAYIGVSPGFFDEMIKSGLMPPAKRIRGRTLWDRLALDAAFAALPEDGQNAESNPWNDTLPPS